MKQYIVHVFVMQCCCMHACAHIENSVKITNVHCMLTQKLFEKKTTKKKNSVALQTYIATAWERFREQVKVRGAVSLYYFELVHWSHFHESWCKGCHLTQCAVAN